jgi:hypothetical protein
MSRDEAMKKLREPAYPDPRQEVQDRIFVMKKLGFTDDTFNEYIRAPAILHQTYGSEKWVSDLLLPINKTLNLVDL